MFHVFEKKSAEELHVELSDGRIMALEDVLVDYERLLKEESLKKVATSETKDDKSTVSKLKVGEWFRIDRNVIDENRDEIYLKCMKEGDEGKKLWKRFEKSNKIAYENLNQYTRIIETYIFKHNWEYKTEQEMRDMCEQIGKGMCDEVICDFELQMRICNGELVHDLIQKADKLPSVRAIKLRNGGTGYFGGGIDNNCYNPPEYLTRHKFETNRKSRTSVPYAFR